MKRNSKRTKAMKSPLPSKAAPPPPTDQKAKEALTKRKKGIYPFLLPTEPDKPASLPSAAVKNACKKGGKREGQKEVVVEEEEEEGSHRNPVRWVRRRALP